MSIDLSNHRNMTHMCYISMLYYSQHFILKQRKSLSIKVLNTTLTIIVLYPIVSNLLNLIVSINYNFIVSYCIYYSLIVSCICLEESKEVQ